MPYISDMACRQAQAEMQSLVLQPFPSVAPSNGLSRDQKLANAALHLEQHEQSIKDEIRKLALCAREYASANAPAAAVVHQTRQEPPITAFGDALRLTRPRHSAKPMVKRTRRSQPSSNGQALNYHVSIAKSAMEKLDSYDEQCQPMLKAIREARDNNRNGGHFTGASGAPTPISSSFPLARQVEREINYDASRDPRRRAINPLI